MDDTVSTPLSDERETAIREISDWIVEGALAGVRVEALLEGVCERFDVTVAPLARGHVAMSTLHPLLEAEARTWRRGQGCTRSGFAHGDAKGEWEKSPMRALIESGNDEMRMRLEGTDEYTQFPALVEFQEMGLTDYFATVTAFSADQVGARDHRDGMISSWSSDQPGGWTDEDLAVLRRLIPRLAVAIKLNNRESRATNVVSAYLGTHAGRRVLDGQIKLGDGETIYSVMWYCDMRGSTPLADSLPADEFIRVLNAYFDCTAGAVLDHGGEVLRFIGDAVLAIFYMEGPGGSERAARVALAAARDAEERMAAANRERTEKGEPELAFGLGLHVGEIMYGNIGVPERIEFSVIGAAANEVARLEGLTKELGETVVVSNAFAALLPIDWQSLGRHALRGVSNEQEVFAPPRR